MQNLELYDKATRKLMNMAMTMGDLPRAKNGMHLVGIVRLLRESFKYGTTDTDSKFLAKLQMRAKILGQCAGLGD